nr:MAG TPA: hypothetical protein [Caudoviricetes sp.]
MFISINRSYSYMSYFIFIRIIIWFIRYNLI